jgi:hypothetical protein
MTGGPSVDSAAAAVPGAESRKGMRKARIALDLRLAVIVRTPASSAVWKSSTLPASPRLTTLHREGHFELARRTRDAGFRDGVVHPADPHVFVAPERDHARRQRADDPA